MLDIAHLTCRYHQLLAMLVMTSSNQTLSPPGDGSGGKFSVIPNIRRGILRFCLISPLFSREQRTSNESKIRFQVEQRSWFAYCVRYEIFLAYLVLAQLAGAAEYTDCISVEGQDPPTHNGCPGYDTE